MGLFGALLAMNAYRREELPGRLRFPAAIMTTILASMLIGELWWWSAIDQTAHAGGLLSGGALYWLMVRKRRLSELLPTPSNVTRLGWTVGIAYALRVGVRTRAPRSLASSRGFLTGARCGSPPEQGPPLGTLTERS